MINQIPAGEISVDQAHRGYTVATDSAGFANVNPLFWKVESFATFPSSPDIRPFRPTHCLWQPTRSAATGEFAGQRCYGYISFESIIEAAAACNSGRCTPADFDATMPTLATTAGATAILEAGRRSLDAGGQPFELIYADELSETPNSIRAKQFNQ